MNKNVIHLIIVYLILFILIAFILLSNKNIIFYNKTLKLKNMNETTQETDLNNQLNALNSSHEEYQNYIQTSKANLATAITSAGVSTSGDDTFEIMINNVSNILKNKTSDATATASQILKNKTAWVNGNKVTGTMANNGAVKPTALNAGGSYTIPAGYHNGSGKVTTNSLESQTQATATADNISAGKTAWVNGNLITGNGSDNQAYHEQHLTPSLIGSKHFNESGTSGRYTGTGTFTIPATCDFFMCMLRNHNEQGGPENGYSILTGNLSYTLANSKATYSEIKNDKYYFVIIFNATANDKINLTGIGSTYGSVYNWAYAYGNYN